MFMTGCVVLVVVMTKTLVVTSSKVDNNLT